MWKITTQTDTEFTNYLCHHQQCQGCWLGGQGRLGRKIGKKDPIVPLYLGELRPDWQRYHQWAQISCTRRDCTDALWVFGSSAAWYRYWLVLVQPLLANYDHIRVTCCNVSADEEEAALAHRICGLNRNKRLQELPMLGQGNSAWSSLLPDPSLPADSLYPLIELIRCNVVFALSTS